MISSFLDIVEHGNAYWPSMCAIAIASRLTCGWAYWHRQGCHACGLPVWEMPAHLCQPQSSLISQAPQVTICSSPDDPTTLFPAPCLYPSPAQPFAHCLWSDSRQEHVVCCWLCCGFAISSETWMCVVPRQHWFHDSVSCQHVFHGFRVMPKVTLGCWLLPRILQVFSFSGNAMPDDISIMTMAGERTRSGPPKDVKQ